MGQTAGLIGLRTMNAYNTNTLNIITSTGKIDLFEDAIIQKIMELNRLQTYEIGVSSGNRDSYFSMYNSYEENYTFNDYGNSTIDNELWANVNAIKHASIYINCLNVHNHAVKRYIGLTKEIVAKTEELLNVLNDLERK